MAKNKISTKRICVCGMLIAAAFVLSFVERFIPIDVAIYGFKLGFANIVVVFALYKLSLADAAFICFVKILLSGLLFGGPIYLMYSFCGGVLSFIVMLMLKNKLNIITVSALGSVFFNIGQIAFACFNFASFGVWTYLPVLIVTGVFTGVLIGIISNIAINRIKI